MAFRFSAAAWFATFTGLLGPCACNDPGAVVADTSTPDILDVSPVVDPALGARDGLRVRSAFGRGSGLFDASVPALDLFGTSTTPGQSRATLADWPGAADHAYLGPILDLAIESRGAASLAGAWFVPLAGLDDAARAALIARSGERLTDLAAMRSAGLGLVAVATDGSLRPAPFAWHFDAAGGPFGAADMLVLKPIAGVPLPPATTCGAFVTADFARSVGATPGRDAGLAVLLSGHTSPWADHWNSDDPRSTPAAHDALYRSLAETLARDLALAAPDLVGLVVAITGDPAATFIDLATSALGTGSVEPGNFELQETFETFCVFSATFRITDFQHGTPPFNNAGDGMWRVGDDGLTPTPARIADSRVVITIPRKPLPANGFPLATFIRTGGGGDRPLVDRGFRPVAGGPSAPPTGAGPAVDLAAAGWAGLTWDGPHGGLRNVSNGDEQFLMFNILNPAAARANIWQTALEAVMLRRLVTSGAALDGLAPCPGDQSGNMSVVFDTNHQAIIGHSMGAWVAPLALALEPAFGTSVLSGAGGGWIENAVFKQKPVAVRPLAALILGYGDDRPLTVFDPALTLLQWAGEAADPQVFGALAMTPARNVLVVQGMVDRYILPPIADALQLALGLDLAGPALDESLAELDEFQPFSEGLGLVGRSVLARPLSANRDGRTAVVVHHPEDGIEDGHEAFFQQPLARRQHRCFLKAVAEGRAPLIDDAGADAPCP